MIAPNVFVAIIGLAAGVIAGPCKPSPGTTDSSTAVASSAETSSIDTTSIISTAATTIEATTTELTTSSAEPTETTETSAAATTTAVAVESCVNNQKTPFPADKVCNKRGTYSGNLTFKGMPDAQTLASCRQGCYETNGCTVFAFIPGQSCWIYSGNIDSADDGQTDYIWYDMECFCDLDDTTATTTAEDTTADATTGAPTLIETAPVN